MRESVYKSYEELPLFLNAKMVAQVLDIAPSSAYELIATTILLKFANSPRALMSHTLLRDERRAEAPASVSTRSHAALAD